MEFRHKHLKLEAIAEKLHQVTVKDVFIGAGIATTAVLLLVMRQYLFLIALIVINILSSYGLRTFRRNQIGIEMVMFTTVMSGAIYGPATGAVMGATAMLIDYAFATRLSYFSVVTIPSYALVGVLSPFLLGLMSITTLGIAMTTAYVIFSNAIICGFMGGHISKSIRFGLTDIAFNIFMFTAIAPFVLKLIM